MTLRRSPCFRPQLRALIRTGVKTQTRRVVRFPDWFDVEDTHCQVDDATDNIKRRPTEPSDIMEYCHPPHGIPGDTWGVIEPLERDSTGKLAIYRDDGRYVSGGIESRQLSWKWQNRTLPQIHMPSVAARTFLRITGLRVERLQSISEADAIAEGIIPWCAGFVLDTNRSYIYRTAVEAFEALWNSINAERGYGWETNPWVWVYQWELINGKA